MTTSNTSFPPPPSWLDPKSEIKTPDQPEDYKNLEKNKKAIVFIMLSLRELGLVVEPVNKKLNIDQIIGILANSILETGWGRLWRGWNLGGWKINKSDVTRATNAGLPCPPWWQAPGNIGSGDPAICYYRGFRSMSHFYTEWVDKFVPINGGSLTNRYRKTGLAFWLDPETTPDWETKWFAELIEAGYKGEVTRAKPQGSIDNHLIIIQSIATRVFQWLYAEIMEAEFGVKGLVPLTPDGDFGTKTKVAMEQFQSRHPELKGEPKTMVTVKTLKVLLNSWKNGKLQCKIPYGIKL